MRLTSLVRFCLLLGVSVSKIPSWYRLGIDRCAIKAILTTCQGSQFGLIFRSIALEEPPKAELTQFLELEHAGKVTAQTSRPARLAKIQYDVIRGDRNHEYTESWVDVVTRKETKLRVVDKIHQAALTL